MALVRDVLRLKKSKIKEVVNYRLKEFEAFKRKRNNAWFSELCFCILTANSRAKTAMNIQNELSANGFICHAHEDLVDCIKRNKHRFHNNKAKYIIEARKHVDVREKVSGLNGFSAREWIVKNVKGIGYKEASHFLRNVGYTNLAILDRHILNLMVEEGLLKKKPKTLTRKLYLEIENIFLRIADKVGMNAAELDLYMWFMKTGEVLK